MPSSLARRASAAGALFVLTALLSACAGNHAASGAMTTTMQATTGSDPLHRAPTRPVRPARLVELPWSTLAAPVQDAAVAPLDHSRLLLLGGLTASDVSTDAVLVAGSSGSHQVARLPEAVHDSAAVRLGADAYLFGGGTNRGTQSDAIVRIDPRTGAATTVGRLPAPSSDQGAASLGNVAYVVGGYTGSRWLDTIVAWSPGAHAHVVAHLPTALRYAAVAGTRGRLVIAGGSLPTGAASPEVFVYRPGHGVVRAARLPAPVTHAAAAALGGLVYVIGGRGAALDNTRAAIFAVDPVARRLRRVGALATPRSDLAAVAVGGHIFLAGGRGPNGTESAVSELAPATAKVASSTSAYAHAGPNMLTGAARTARSLIYVPNSLSGTVDVIDPATYKVVEHFQVGALPQHVVPSYDLRTLYVTNDNGNSLTAIDPATGKPGRTIPVDDPYNMYFTPGGRYAIVVAERNRRLDFRDAHSFKLHHSLTVPCAGVDHMDFSLDGRYLIASCEFSGQLVKVDVAHERVIGTLDLPDGSSGMPQDVRISPDGTTFYVADMMADGVWKVDGDRLAVTGFVRTGKGTHGLYPSRDGKFLYVTNREEGSVSVLSFATGRVVEKWRLPGGGSPDMGGVSADGKVLWLSGRYNSEVYAIDTSNGHLLARIPVGAGPHGLCVWPQPGRYSLGHTGNMR